MPKATAPPPPAMTGKDIDITTVAFLKSAIEAGVPADQWQDYVSKAWRVFLKTTTSMKAGKKPSAPAPKEVTDDILGGK